MLLTYADYTRGLTLVPGGSGMFEVVVNGKMIFSKRAEGRFPEILDLKEGINAFLE